MRKHAPALIVTALFAMSSASALAMGDRHKEKKANSDTSIATQSTPSSSSYTAPSAATPAPASQSMKTDNTGSPAGATSSYGSTSAAADTADKRKQVARNDPKCDESKVARESMPKDCFEKSGTSAAAVGSTQGQSGK